MKFTARAIGELKCPKGKRDKLFFDGGQRGLAVRVTAGGSKSYLTQYTFNGQRRRVPLGACSAISLADARRAAASILGDVAVGIDPAADRKAQREAAKAEASRQALTLATMISNWQSLHLSDKSEKHSSEAVRALKTAFEKQWDNPADDLTRQDVIRVLDAMVKRGRKAMAVRTAAYGRAAYRWARRRGAVQNNPFEDLPSPASVVARERVLSDEELREVWEATSSIIGPYGAIVRMLIVTGQRRGEVASMVWGEVSKDLATWTLPGRKTKNRQPHIVPLSAGARVLIGKRPKDAKDDDLVFPGRGDVPFAGWGKAKRQLDEIILENRLKGVKPAKRKVSDTRTMLDWRLHDLRRSVATGLQRLGVRLEVTEAILNHVSGSRAGIVATYQRHNWAAEKKAALDAWGAHVEAIVPGRAKTDSNVIRLGASE